MRTGIIGGRLGYHLLRWISLQGETGHCAGTSYDGRSKLETLFGDDIWRVIEGRVVLDFGCGEGNEAIELARHGARRVIGLDLRPHLLEKAVRRANTAGVGSLCQFALETTDQADVILSVDSFEHFADPAAVLRSMAHLLAPDGRVLVSFGPPWLHPLGGHLFSVFPWAHLFFTESALICWRSDFKSDGAKHFGEVEGGLNQMTIRRFEQLVEESDFEFVSFEAVPIRATRALHNALTREFLTSIVRCQLARRPL